MNALNEISEFDLISSLKKDLSEKTAKLLVAYVKQQAIQSTSTLVTSEDLTKQKLDIFNYLNEKLGSFMTKIILLIISQLGVLIAIILVFLK